MWIKRPPPKVASFFVSITSKKEAALSDGPFGRSTSDAIKLGLDRRRYRLRPFHTGRREDGCLGRRV